MQQGRLHLYCRQKTTRLCISNVYTIIVYCRLAEHLQYHCGVIRQMFTFLINVSCQKGYHRPGHSIRIAEYNRKSDYP
jgi:hypothetical protein